MYPNNFSSQGPHWLMGHITKFTGPVSVLVELEDGSLIKRHFDQIRKKLTRTSENTLSDSEEAEGASTFVSYPPENSTATAHSETNTGTTSTESQPTNSDITTETAEIPVSHPSNCAEFH